MADAASCVLLYAGNYTVMHKPTNEVVLLYALMLFKVLRAVTLTANDSKVTVIIINNF